MRQAVNRRLKPRMAMSRSFPAPTSGLIANQNRAIASERMPTGEVLRGAAVLENWFPTATGIRVRGGYARHATVGSPSTVTAMMTYVAGNVRRMFAATASAIFDVTSPADPNVSPSAAVSGLGGGDWIAEQFGTAGAIFLRCVNGVDTPRVFDGSAWSTTPAITGVVPSASALNFVWSFKNRLFFLVNNSLTAYYLPVDQIGGAAVAFPMAGVFKRGGSLLFGATLSSDSGDGLDDRCIFATTEGEVAVYEGSDPGSASTWQLANVYTIGRPLGKRAFAKAGGDVMVATDAGLVSIMASMTLDYAALAEKSVSAPIMTLWNELASRRIGDWEVVVWPSQRMGIVAVPPATNEPLRHLVINLGTGAWSTFTNMDFAAIAVLGENLFFGTRAGRVFVAETTGLDDGAAFTATVIPLFDDCRAPLNRKVARLARPVLIAPRPVGDRLTMKYDYDVSLPLSPDDAAAATSGVWGAAVWGTGVWSDFLQRFTYQAWRAASGTGFAIAPCYQITSGGIAPADAELVRIDVTYEQGDLVT